MASLKVSLRGFWLSAFLLGCTEVATQPRTSSYVSKISPASLEPSEGSEGAWALFDRSVREGWSPADGALVTVQLPERASLSGLKVYGKAPYKLSLLDENGTSLPGASFDLSSL